MKLALLCDPGAEKYAVREVKELVGKDATTGNSYVLFEGSEQDAATLCYRSQLASHVLALVSEGKMSSLDGLQKRGISSFDFTPFLGENGTFRVRCERHGEHDFGKQEVEERIGSMVDLPVDLKESSMTVACHIRGTDYVVGVDLGGRDLGKRDYKVFHTRRSLRATVAYAALLAAGYTGKEVLVDPFANDGAIVIEAAMKASGSSPHRHRKEFAFFNMPAFARVSLKDDLSVKPAPVTGFADSIRLLKMARGNAKIAGVEKVLALTKCEVSWLDTKFEKESVDLIVTLPPCSGKSTPLKEVEKLQHDLFRHAHYVLQENGKLLVVADKKAEFMNAAERHGFKLEKEEELWMGEHRLKLLGFSAAD